jgi:hypothetical protein
VSEVVDVLKKWINPIYVQEYTDGTLGARRESEPFSHVVLENFFSEEGLQILLNQADSTLTERSHRMGIAEKADWYWGAFANLNYIRFFLGKEMRLFLNALTERRLVVKSGVVPQFNIYRPQSPGLPIHTDTAEEVNLVTLIQLSQGYEPGLGGELVFYNKNDDEMERIREIAPICNKLIMFEVSDFSFHGVDDMKGDWSRRTIMYDWLAEENCVP